MSFDIPQMHIPDDSPEAHAVENVMQAERVGPREAVLSILRNSLDKTNPALAGLGLFSNPEDAAALDAAVALTYQERHQPSQRKVGL